MINRNYNTCCKGRPSNGFFTTRSMWLQLFKYSYWSWGLTRIHNPCQLVVHSIHVWSTWNIKKNILGNVVSCIPSKGDNSTRAQNRLFIFRLAFMKTRRQCLYMLSIYLLWFDKIMLVSSNFQLDQLITSWQMSRNWVNYLFQRIFEYSHRNHIDQVLF